MFVSVLAQRFPGQVTPEIESRVNAADKATLDTWLGRALKVPTIAALFTP